jgi:hypothetical protein
MNYKKVCVSELPSDRILSRASFIFKLPDAESSASTQAPNLSSLRRSIGPHP